MNLLFASPRLASFIAERNGRDLLAEIGADAAIETSQIQRDKTFSQRWAETKAKIAAEKAQAEAQSDRDALSSATANGGAQRIAFPGEGSYVWTPVNYGSDRGFWMLEAEHYKNLEIGQRLTLSVQEMAAKLIARSTQPAPLPREDEIGAEPIANFAWTLSSATVDPYEDREAIPTSEDGHDDETGRAIFHDFRIGDVVVLLSGSPELTVFDVIPCDECGSAKELMVMWFDDGVIKRDRVPVDTVDLAE